MASPQPRYQPRTPAPLEWVRPAVQGRSQDTLERLLAAAEALLADRSFDEIGVAEVARAARSSVGSFYARFTDKEAVLRALHERFIEEALATADAALDPERWEGTAIPEIVAALIGFLVQISRDRRGLVRAVVIRGHADGGYARRHAELLRYVSEGFARLLLARKGEIAAADPERAIDFALLQAGAVLDTAILGLGLDFSRIERSDDEIAGETTTAFLSYLGVRPAR